MCYIFDLLQPHRGSHYHRYGHGCYSQGTEVWCVWLNHKSKTIWRPTDRPKRVQMTTACVRVRPTQASHQTTPQKTTHCVRLTMRIQNRHLFFSSSTQYHQRKTLKVGRTNLCSFLIFWSAWERSSRASRMMAQRRHLTQVRMLVEINLPIPHPATVLDDH